MGENIEFALKESHEAFKVIFDNTSLGIYIANTKGDILDANNALLKLLGSPSLEATKKINLLTFKPLVENGYSKLFKECVETNNTINFEITYKSFWGKESIFFVHIIPKADKDGVVKNVYTIMNDITEKRGREYEEILNQKLKSIGVLAGGIAHDFNNLLNGVFGNLSLIKYTLEDNHPALELLESAELSIERAKSLTKQLLTFSKGGEPILSVLEADIFIKEIVLFHLSGSNIKPIFNISKNIKLIKADKGQIEQVISNMIINSIHAMPDGGVLDVSISNIFIKNKNKIKLEKGEYLQISIKDHGIGIPREHMQSIFDPYFTTKAQGTGLGLATSYSIIDKHHGTITVDSKINEYTEFNIFLPTLKTENSNKTNEKLNFLTDDSTNYSKKKLNILIMDDEYIIRKLLTKMLSFLGHDVIATSRGEEAIKKYIKSMKSNQKIDLLIVDLTIPGGLGGKETVKRILNIDSNVPCIVSSGYSNDPVMANYEKYGFIGALEKPYTIDLLKAAIEKAFN